MAGEEERMTDRLGLTPQQLQLLTFIRSEIDAGRPSPTFDEMRVVTGLKSKSGISRLVRGLESRGHIVRAKNSPRSIGLPPPQRTLCDLCRHPIPTERQASIKMVQA